MNSELQKFLESERLRQEENIELIASENYVSNAILECQGSILTNKYAEGYPGKRYYGGCENIDDIEAFAIEKACKLFNCKYANVQPHSGSSANMAVLRALLKKNDKILSMDFNNGGHLSHGHKNNFSGQDYNIVTYSLDPKTEKLDYNEIEKIAIKEKPNLIIAGASAYPREIDFKKFRKIANKTNAILMVDMAHIAGLVVAGVHQSPLKYADVVTSTTHKTLRGPRGGLILTNNEEIIKKINKTVFPGIQGGPLEHVIMAKAQCFCEALDKNFISYAKQIIKNTKALEKAFNKENIKMVTGGSDNHLILINVKEYAGITGKEAEKILDKVNITVNKNAVPNETESYMETSGIRLGTAAMTTRGLKEKDFEKIGHIIAGVLKNYNDENKLNEYKKEVSKITKKYPLWYK